MIESKPVQAVIFLLIALLFTMPLELIFTPGRLPVFLQDPLAGIMELKGAAMFQTIFGIIGALIYLLKIKEPKKLGIISLILGFICEFTFMRPDWVLVYLGLSQVPNLGALIVPTIISAFYWWGVWGIPAYVLKKL